MAVEANTGQNPVSESTINGEAPAPVAANGARRPGQLFIPEDFALADLPAVDIWDRMVNIATREQASDLHLTYQRDGLHVGLRLDGRMAHQGVLPTDLGNRVTNHVKVIAGLDVGENRRPQDGHLHLTLDSRPVDARISVLPTNHGQDIAVRILDRETSLRDIDELGVLDHQMRDLLELLDSPSGLILVTGSTGAGKTTTLYALLKRLADGMRKIVTIENPIEYDLPDINQSEVNYRIGLDYPALLRAVMRQDPNVIMIGEIRDAETADVVVRAANSGRLVLATSHAVHVAAALESLISLGANPHFVARAFRGAIAQTLLRRLCPYCTVRIEETADAVLFDNVTHLLGPKEHPALSLGRGCPYCRHTGYRGRMGVFEVLAADEEVRQRIATDATARDLYAFVRERGMITIGQAGKVAALRGQTTIEELLRHVSELWTGEKA